MGNWVGNNTSNPGASQSQHSYPGDDAQLGAVLSIYSFRTVVVDFDTGAPVAVHVYCALLALGQR